jgi:hypothetical protein
MVRRETLGGTLKKIIIALLLGLPSIVRAQSLSVPLVNTQLDLASIVQQMHPCYVFDQHRDNLAGAYIVGLDLHTAPGTSIAQINGGFAWQVASGVGGPMLSLGLRVDNLVSRAMSQSWLQTHATALKLPAIEVGPFGSYINNLGWLYGLFVSTKL